MLAWQYWLQVWPMGAYVPSSSLFLITLPEEEIWALLRCLVRGFMLKSFIETVRNRWISIAILVSIIGAGFYFDESTFESSGKETQASSYSSEEEQTENKVGNPLELESALPVSLPGEQGESSSPLVAIQEELDSLSAYLDERAENYRTQVLLDLPKDFNTLKLSARKLPRELGRYTSEADRVRQQLGTIVQRLSRRSAEHARVYHPMAAQLETLDARYRSLINVFTEEYTVQVNRALDDCDGPIKTLKIQQEASLDDFLRTGCDVKIRAAQNEMRNYESKVKRAHQMYLAKTKGVLFELRNNHLL